MDRDLVGHLAGEVSVLRSVLVSLLSGKDVAEILRLLRLPEDEVADAHFLGNSEDMVLAASTLAGRNLEKERLIEMIERQLKR